MLLVSGDDIDTLHHMQFANIRDCISSVLVITFHFSLPFLFWQSDGSLGSMLSWRLVGIWTGLDWD